jgi:hypothetical protein
LLKRAANDREGFLTASQVRDTEGLARTLGIRLLWAGGLALRDAYEMGRVGVFGVYVTSAAATTIAVGGSYVRDPSLAGVKEPSKEAVLRTKILLEAGFLSTKLAGETGGRIERLAHALLAAHDLGNAAAMASHTSSLAAACAGGWRAHWRPNTRRRALCAAQ